jgi:hypothetical protein
MTDVLERLDRYGSTIVRNGGVDRARKRAATSPPRLSADGLIRVNRTIEAQIIPRLLLAHRRRPPASAALPATEQELPCVIAVADLLLAGDADRLGSQIEAFRFQGHSLETIYLQFLAPVALHLRERWSEDSCGFAELALALWHLQQVMRNYGTAFRAESLHRETGRRVLLLPSPREQHDLCYAMFCLMLRSEFFRRGGWDSWIESDATTIGLRDVIGSQWFDVVEIVASGGKQLDALAGSIRFIRRHSQNRSVGVMVCGQVFVENPELVLLVGADQTATDARQGAAEAHHLVGQLAGQT